MKDPKPYMHAMEEDMFKKKDALLVGERVTRSGRDVSH